MGGSCCSAASSPSSGSGSAGWSSATTSSAARWRRVPSTSPGTPPICAANCRPYSRPAPSATGWNWPCASDCPSAPAHQGVASLRTTPRSAARQILVEGEPSDRRPLHVRGRAVIVDEQPYRVARPAPAFGANTTEILEELGYNESQIAQLFHRRPRSRAIDRGRSSPISSQVAPQSAAARESAPASRRPWCQPTTWAAPKPSGPGGRASAAGWVSASS